MNVLDRCTAYLNFPGEDGSSLDVGYDNRGEPYREGVSLCLNTPSGHGSRYVFLDRREVKELQKLLATLFPDKSKVPAKTESRYNEHITENAKD